jgi:hypothetical protein
MTAGECVVRLTKLPKQLAEAEKFLMMALDRQTGDLARADDRIAEHKEALQAAEDAILLAVLRGLEEPLMGKNAETRAAEIRERTALQRERLRDAERDRVQLARTMELAVAQCKLHLKCLQNQFAAAKEIARLLAQGE